MLRWGHLFLRRPLPCFRNYAIRSMVSSETTTDLVVSILGPPNAGKSTLFNRLMCKQANKAYRLKSDRHRHRRKGQSKGRIGGNVQPTTVGGAIVTSIAGTTRDRRECIGRIGSTTFRLIDTAGIDGYRQESKSGSLDRSMLEQTLLAAKQSDLVLLMWDAKVGITTDFMETARFLRKGIVPGQETRICVLANKLEGDNWAYPDSEVMEHLSEAARMGFGEAIPISAQHGEGMADIAVTIEEQTRAKHQRLGLIEEETIGTEQQGEKPLQLAILGRQNVGKSTLVNALLQHERVITGPTPGLTRDAIAIQWSWQGRLVQLVDTAGIRKMTKRADDIEDLAVQDAMRAMKTADVAVLVLDAEARYLTRQELVIADAVVKEGRSLVVAANKSDLLVDAEYSVDDYAKAVQEQIHIKIPPLRQTPVVGMSALQGKHVDDLMPVVFNARDRWARVISTGVLNRWLAEVLQGQLPPMQHGRPTKIKYIVQTRGRPPSFILFCNVDELPDSYMRYLMRNFQETFEMFGMEVRIAVRKSANNPYSSKVKNPRAGSGLGGKDARRGRRIDALKTTGTTKIPKKRKSKHTQRKSYKNFSY